MRLTYDVKAFLAQGLRLTIINKHFDASGIVAMLIQEGDDTTIFDENEMIVFTSWSESNFRGQNYIIFKAAVVTRIFFI